MDAVTWQGLDERRRALEAVPGIVARHLRAVAFAAAVSIRDAAQRDVPKAKNHAEHHIAFVIEENDRDQTVTVSDKVRNPKAANLPLWLEFGTVHMPARPYFFPAVARARAAFPAQTESALQAAFNEARLT